MEDSGNFVVFDTIEAEERYLQGKSSTPSASTRRLSAAGRAALLKKNNLIPPLHSPTDRRISLPRASKPPREEPVASMPLPDKRKAKQTDPPQPGDQPEPASTVPSPSPTEKFIQEQLAALTAMISSVKADIGRAESRTVEKIDSKVDDLAGKLDVRLSKAETDLARLGGEVATTRQQLDTMRLAAVEREKALPGMVEEILRARVPPTPSNDRQGAGRRHRPLTSDQARTITAGRGNNDDKYWLARRTLRLWPIPGDDDLETAVVSFLERKLMCPPARVLEEDIEVKRVYTPPESTAQHQVLVTFATIALRDEVKSMAKNLRGQDRSIGVQIEPPDHLRSHFQAFQRLAFQLKRKNPLLRRNVKFYDTELSLIMDVKVNPESDWKSILYEQAREILKKTRARTESFSLEELESMADVEQGGQKKRRRETLLDSDSDSDEHDSTIIDLTENENQNKNGKTSRRLCFINTNARSLGPKVESLYDCFEEKQVDLAFLTETWYQSDRSLADKLDEYGTRFSLGALVRNRSHIANNGRSYGGVALIYRKSKASFENFHLTNPDDHEVLAAVGKVHGIKGKIVCITAYAPPNLAQSKARELLEFISDVIGEAKRKFENCTIICAGDFNQWPAQELVQDHPDLVEVVHGPTRGDREIDRSFVNFGRAIQESGTLPALETEDGRESDHKIAWAVASFKVPPSANVTYKYRAYTERGAEAFLSDLNNQNWTRVYEAPDTDRKAVVFEEIVEALLEKNFKWRTIVRKDGEPPWVNETLRKLWKKRRRIYDREGRSPRWKRLKKKSVDIYRKRAAGYVKLQKEKLTGPDANKDFFKHVKTYASKEKPKGFDIADLFPEDSEQQIAEKLAEHFTKVGGPSSPLTEADIPTSYSNPKPDLDPSTVMNKIKTMRKAKSTVKGDIFPCLLNRAAGAISFPLTDIFNAITHGDNWPKSWKVEYVTPIPKNTCPEGVNDLRNISCTQFFSKTYESFVLDWLASEVTIRTNQYGGVKGSGAEHFLLQLWQQVLENLEDPRAASLLTSIDYSKAFNRLDYAACLKALKSKGASTETLRILASFLTDRTMTVKVGNAFSAMKGVDGGAPQGSLLGVSLFNAYIDDFEAFSDDVVDYNPFEDYTLTDRAPNCPPDTPVPREPGGRDYRHLPPWAEQLLQVLKYIDDNIINEKINFDNTPTGPDFSRVKRALRTENLFRRIVHQARSLGMVVNGRKTNMLCISDLKSYVPHAYIYDSEGTKVESKDDMKILGFHFSSSPDMSAQVEAIRKGFVARIWTLRHLGHRGLDKADLLKVYRSIMLPVHDYCSCVYNSSLTQQQASALERLQAQALKAIYGYEHSYRALLEMTGLQTLQQRRNARSDKFASKCLASSRFRRWFEPSDAPRSTRHTLRYKESHARTKRLYNSPLFFMRRRLNGREA